MEQTDVSKSEMDKTDVSKSEVDKTSEVNASTVQSHERQENIVESQQQEITPANSDVPHVKTGCGAAGTEFATSYPCIYAIGRVNVRFPTLGVEKEYAQALARAGKETTGLTDQKAQYTLLKDPANRYLVRQLCWVMTIEGIDTYILQPRGPNDFAQLVETIRPAQSHEDIDVVIGVKGPIATPEMCNGLLVPIVGFDQIYSFDRPKLLEALKEKRPENMSEEEFTATAEEVFDRFVQIADNAGATDEHRALNYLAVTSVSIYAKTVEMHNSNFSLTEVTVGTSRLSGVRKIVDPTFRYINRETQEVMKYFMRVDITEEFPFLVTALAQSFDL